MCPSLHSHTLSFVHSLFLFHSILIISTDYSLLILVHSWSMRWFHSIPFDDMMIPFHSIRLWFHDDDDCRSILFDYSIPFHFYIYSIFYSIYTFILPFDSYSFSFCCYSFFHCSVILFTMSYSFYFYSLFHSLCYGDWLWLMMLLYDVYSIRDVDSDSVSIPPFFIPLYSVHSLLLILFCLYGDSFDSIRIGDPLPLWCFLYSILFYVLWWSICWSILLLYIVSRSMISLSIHSIHFIRSVCDHVGDSSPFLLFHSPSPTILLIHSISLSFLFCSVVCSHSVLHSSLPLRSVLHSSCSLFDDGAYIPILWWFHSTVPFHSMLTFHSIPFHDYNSIPLLIHSIAFHSIWWWWYHSIPFYSIPFHRFHSIPFHSIDIWWFQYSIWWLLPFHSIPFDDDSIPVMMMMIWFDDYSFYSIWWLMMIPFHDDDTIQFHSVVIPLVSVILLILLLSPWLFGDIFVDTFILLVFVILLHSDVSLVVDIRSFYSVDSILLMVFCYTSIWLMLWHCRWWFYCYSIHIHCYWLSHSSIVVDSSFLLLLLFCCCYSLYSHCMLLIFPCQYMLFIVVIHSPVGNFISIQYDIVLVILLLFNLLIQCYSVILILLFVVILVLIVILFYSIPAYSLFTLFIPIVHCYCWYSVILVSLLIWHTFYSMYSSVFSILIQCGNYSLFSCYSIVCWYSPLLLLFIPSCWIVVVIHCCSILFIHLLFIILFCCYSDSLSLYCCCLFCYFVIAVISILFCYCYSILLFCVLYSLFYSCYSDYSLLFWLLVFQFVIVTIHHLILHYILCYSFILIFVIVFPFWSTHCCIHSSLFMCCTLQ